ncbi:hypothetical protein D5F01_LYC09867 [Larimichthys crocea]|uniref:Integrase catalytic domain-containing protein n=1 Tax=Larimichthys crocea TaxID=215358 RepID=A0A6G0IMD4_LARCR|nr:hypothetical protein D5F01_LYC09867 [Larimichthys crocea]
MSNGGRKSLVWDIRKSLLTLSAEELFRVARAVDPELDADQSEPMERDQEVYYDHINSFMYKTRPTDKTARGSPISQGPKKFCLFCDNNKHSLNNCANFKFLNSAQKQVWIQDNNRCWRCGRNHRAAECDLKMCCKTCNNRHLLALHEISGKTLVKADKPTPAVSGPAGPTPPNRGEEVLYIGKPPQGQRVLLKVSKVVLRNGDQTLETYGILDDGYERTLLLHSAAKQLGLQGEPENLPLRTVRQEPQTLHGAAVSFTVSPASSPHKVFRIRGAFTAPQLGLGEHTYPVRALQRKLKHMRDLLIQQFKSIHPLLLIGSDHSHLITPIEPVHSGPPGTPFAVRTRLGWTLQGPTHGLKQYLTDQNCLFTSYGAPPADLYRQVERLWQVDVLPWQNEKASMRSRQDQEALSILDAKIQLQTTSAQSEDFKKPAFCGINLAPSAPSVPDATQFATFSDLITATAHSLHGAAKEALKAEDYRKAQVSLLQRVQLECFPMELAQLRSSKPVLRSSRLLTLAPEFDNNDELIRVGGRLHHSSQLDPEAIHPVVLDTQHPITQLIIKDIDEQLHQPGPERVFSEIRRKYWIPRGREAVRRHQRGWTECQRWRSKPEIPKMADLPPARLRLFKPAFFSTGVDCFGPYSIKIGRRSEKHWGILFKCMTTRAVHVDILSSIDTDAFLMALRRFIARRGKPFELLSDQGTNFKGGDRELQEAFAALQPDLQEQLAPQQIHWKFNPPSAPHFGGCWEREIRSIKQALQVTLGAQPVTEEVLRTLLIEVEGILNSKPLGYTSSDIADPDPITPNSLLIGRPDASLPQVVYPESELLGRRRWRHSQLLADNFWRNFIKVYMPSLQARQKARTSQIYTLGRR